MSKKIETSFLIVNYHSRDVLERCLNCLNKALDQESYEILIANSDDEELKIQSAINHCKVIEMGDNGGFAVSNNKIAQKAQGEILFFLNPDTFDMSENILTGIYMLKDRKIGIVAPKICNDDGTWQEYSYGKMVTPVSIISHNIKKIFKTYKWEKTQKEGFFEVSWVTGAAFALRKDVFLKVGGFDENFFLYFEDIDLCRRIQEHGYKIMINAEIALKHSSGKSNESHTKQKSHYFASQDYYIQKHHGKLMVHVIKFLRKLTDKS